MTASRVVRGCYLTELSLLTHEHGLIKLICVDTWQAHFQEHIFFIYCFFTIYSFLISVRG
jgi:hypothetical protein